MTGANDHISARVRMLRSGSSTWVLGAVLMVTTPSVAMAQEEPAATNETPPLSAQTDPEVAATPDEPVDKDTIIVTGTRRALQTSQNIKRNADTVVDSITATDIGAFPDKSVAEALQRVPGITVNRFAATSDTAHFSAEPSGVIVRGLPQVRSEFNGRDSFSANSSRGLSWGDISPELMAGVDTYKNQTADMIEGGIAGSINLRTRVPFDATGQLIQASVNANYGDLSKKITPEFSAYYSNRWMTGIGEVGLMADIAYSKVETASQGIQYGREGIFDNVYGQGTKYIPSQVFFRDNVYNRERQGIALAGQWQDVDHQFLLTAQYNRSVYKNAWRERAIGAYLFDLYGQNVRFRLAPGALVPQPAPGTPAFTFDQDGNFQTGVFNLPEAAHWFGCPTGTPPWGGSQADYGCGPPTNAGYALNDEGEPMFPTCYSWAGSCPGAPSGWGVDINSASRINRNRNMTQDAALNLKWEASDRLHFNFDGQFVDSKIDNYDISVEVNSFANVGLDATGTYPRIVLSPPTNINQSSGGLSNLNNWYLRSVMDHLEHSTGQEWAFRADGQYDLGSDWLDSLKFGARYADRDQDVRWSRYNWQNVSNTWTDTNAPYWNLDSQPSGSFHGYPQGAFETAPFGASFFGGDLGTFAFVPFEFLEQHRADEFSLERTGVGQFIPICERNGQLSTTPVELADSCFVQDEITSVSESTKAGYAMLKFGGANAKIGGLGVSGNLGLRYIETVNESEGSIAHIAPNYDFAQCDGIAPPPQPGQPTPVADPAYCYLTAADIAFATAPSVQSVVREKHRHLLPSFNLRLDLSDNWLVRFAASRALSRPDIGLLKNYIGISQGLPQSTNPSDPRWVKDAGGNVIGVTPTYTANAFNPHLAPTTAWQFDLSVENYFANVGSFTFALFYKKFYDYIQYGAFEEQVTSGGATRTVTVRGPANGKGAKIQGFEVAYQRFLDFLPKPLDGLGIQANYTYVKNSGVPNSNLSIVGTSGETTNAGNANTALNPNSLEGLSKHSFNLVGMYEKGPIAARLAYNWRSRYLVTAVDCCVYLPVWQEPAGFLDGSIRARLTDNVEVKLEVSNILNTKTVLRQQIADTESPEGKIVLAPNGWFQNDRRYVLGARFRF